MQVCVWDMETLERLARVGHEGVVLALAEMCGKIFSGSDDSTITVWDSSSLKCLGTLNDHEGAVMALAAGDSHLFSGSLDMTIRWASAYHLSAYPRSEDAVLLFGAVYNNVSLHIYDNRSV